MGVFSGDLGFEEDYYNNNKATAVVSTIDTTVKLLHDRSCAAADSLLYSYIFNTNGLISSAHAGAITPSSWRRLRLMKL